MMKPAPIVMASLSLALCLSGCRGGSEPATTRNTATETHVSPFQSRLNNATKEPQNWALHGGTYAEQRFSSLGQINTTNVGQLKLAWAYDFDTSRGQEATPLVIDGVMYVTSAWSKVYALDAQTGRRLWAFDPKVPGETGVRGCCDVVNRGAAYYDGKVFVGTFDGRLIALDAKDGRQLWSVVTVDQGKPYTITGAPRVFRDKVVIGNGGAEYGVRGYVTAYDVNNGRLVWRFYTVPGDPNGPPDHAASDAILKSKAAATWFGPFWKGGGGGTAWDSIVYDPDLNQLYIGAGNGSPWNQRIRSEGKGDNLFLASIIAVDADTGAYKWHYQENPGETWDFTATQQMTLADLIIDGRQRKVLMQAPKNGFFYVLDRTTGRLLSARPFSHVNWATGVDLKTGRPVEAPGARYQDKPFLNYPSGAGAHSWHPMSFSPKTGLVYIPVQEIPALYVNDTKYRRREGLWNTGVDFGATPLPRTPQQRAAAMTMLKGWLLAWDPIAGKEVWRVPHDGPFNGGTLATAGDLVFQGTSKGTFEAYSAQSGRRLWDFANQAGIIAGPISYAVGSQQFIAVLAGYGGGPGLGLPSFSGPRSQPNGRVLVFSLGGTATLPTTENRPAAINVPREHWTPEQIVDGERLFVTTCAMCHGPGTYSGGVVPDLKRSGALMDKSAWNAIVIDGVLKDQGMASFARWLTPVQAENIRAFVAAKAREEAPPARRQ
jgi:quinohemoprotein ethanol dehydrogenase